MKQRMRVVRPQTTVPEPKPRSFGLTLVLIILTLVILITVLSSISPGNKRSFFHDWFAKPPTTQAPATTPDNILASVARKRTTEEMEKFWSQELNDLVMNRWLTGKLPYPEINDRLKVLHHEIIRKTDKPMTIGLIKNYHWAGINVAAVCGFNPTNNTYYIQLIIPNAMDMFEILSNKRPPQWREKFESHIVISLMHELEHTTTVASRSGNTVDVPEESRAWAETCRYTIVPLRQKYHVPMNEAYMNFLVAWTQGNGDTNSIPWIIRMQKSYGQFEGKTKSN